MVSVVQTEIVQELIEESQVNPIELGNEIIENFEETKLEPTETILTNLTEEVEEKVEEISLKESQINPTEIEQEEIENFEQKKTEPTVNILANTIEEVKETVEAVSQKESKINPIEIEYDVIENIEQIKLEPTENISANITEEVKEIIEEVSQKESQVNPIEITNEIIANIGQTNLEPSEIISVNLTEEVKEKINEVSQKESQINSSEIEQEILENLEQSEKFESAHPVDNETVQEVVEDLNQKETYINSSELVQELIQDLKQVELDSIVPVQTQNEILDEIDNISQKETEIKPVEVVQEEVENIQQEIVESFQPILTETVQDKIENINQVENQVKSTELLQETIENLSPNDQVESESLEPVHEVFVQEIVKETSQTESKVNPTEIIQETIENILKTEETISESAQPVQESFVNEIIEETSQIQTQVNPNKLTEESVKNILNYEEVKYVSVEPVQVKPEILEEFKEELIVNENVQNSEVKDSEISTDSLNDLVSEITFETSQEPFKMDLEDSIKQEENTLDSILETYQQVSPPQEATEESVQQDLIIVEPILDIVKEIMSDTDTNNLLEQEITPKLAEILINQATEDTENLLVEQTVDEIIDQFGNFIFGSNQKLEVDKNDTSNSQIVSNEQEYVLIKNFSDSQQVPNLDLNLEENKSKSPRFTQKLTNQDFYENENIHLDCFVEGEQPITIRWFINDRLIRPNEDSNVEIYRELGVCSMEIISANLNYQGEYKCHASNDYGFDITNCKLNLLNANKKSRLIDEEEEPLEFVELLKDQVVELKSEVFLDCCVKNIRKTDKIEWYFNHEFIQPDQDSNIEIFTELGVCSLQIRRMQPELQGFYSCKVRDIENYVVAETGCYILLVEEPMKLNLTNDQSKLSIFNIRPYFTNELVESINLKEGSSLNLSCRLNSDCEPKPSIIWFKDGKNLNGSKYYNLAFIPKLGECRLFADNCDKYQYEGVYTCVAALPGSSTDFVAKTECNVRIISSNDEDQEQTDSSSDERSTSFVRGVAPMFLQKLVDTELEEGDDLELKCQIMGAPIPEIACYFSKEISEKSGLKKIKSDYVTYNYETGICRIQLKNVTHSSNDGYYMVKAVNDAGTLSTSCQVKIKFKSYPLLNLEEETEPKFLNELETETRVMDGQEVCLTCVCSAKPEPEIKWLKSSHENLNLFLPVVYTSDVKPSFDSTTGKCTLKINDTYPQDAGTYICVASNKLGQTETRTHLVVECKKK